MNGIQCSCDLCVNARQKTTKWLVGGVSLLIIGFLALVATGCFESTAPSTIPTAAQSSSTCSAQGTGNTVNCAQATPTPSSTPNCVPQTAPFTCVKGTPVFEAILSTVQRGVVDAPEPIYVANLVKALNLHPDVCAVSGPSSDEVTVKSRVSNSVSETIDVVNANGTPQFLYVTSCFPARF